MKIGENDISKVYLGGSEITSICLGSTSIYSGGSQPTPSEFHTISGTSYYSDETFNIKINLQDVTVSADTNGDWSYTTSGSITSISGMCSGNSFITSADLTNINYPYIDKSAFQMCDSLSAVTIQPECEVLSGGSFGGCTSLESIHLPSGVTAIGNNVFYGDTGLTAFTIDATVPPTMGTTPLYQVTCPIYVPCDSVNAYKAANGWSGYSSQIDCISEDTWINSYELQAFSCQEYDENDKCINYGGCVQWDEWWSECLDEVNNVPVANVHFEDEYGGIYDYTCPYVSKVRINQNFIDGLESGYHGRWTIDSEWYGRNGNDWVKMGLCVEFYKTPNDVTYARMRFNTKDDDMWNGAYSLSNPIDINGVASGLVIDFDSTYGMPIAFLGDYSDGGLDFVLATSAPSGSNFSFDSAIDSRWWDDYFDCSMQCPEWMGGNCQDYEKEFNCTYRMDSDYDNDDAKYVMCEETYEDPPTHLWDEGDERSPWDISSYPQHQCGYHGGDEYE